jgi:p-cumate 2,3-dioxygenase beta subunit
MTSATSSGGTTDPELQREVEDFLYREAELLDEWRLDDWLALLGEDVVYEIPSTDPVSGDLTRELGFVHDDRERVEARVTRLKSRHAHREFPSSRTRRLVTNVRVEPEDGGDRLRVAANFAVWRFRSDHADTFVGRYEYLLVRVDADLTIARKRATLDLERLHPHGTVSILL